MKFKLFLILGLLLSSIALKAAPYCLIVDLKNSEKFTFALSDKPVITFKAGEMVVNGSSSTSYAISEVKNYHFEEVLPTAAENISKDELRIFQVDENTIQIYGANPGAQVVVVSIAGVVVSAQYADADGAATLQLPSQKGVFVVAVGDRSFKFIRK